MRSRILVRSFAAFGVVLAAGFIGAGTASAAPAKPASASAGTCADGTDPAKFPAGELSSPRKVYVRDAPASTLVELRYDNNFQCAWGRISAGTTGDTVWVERKATPDTPDNEAKTLGTARIDSGTTNHTLAFNDAGLVMRACGLPIGSPIAAARCTDWF